MRDRTVPRLLALTFAVGLTVLAALTLGSPTVADGGPVPEVDEPAPPELAEITIEEPIRPGPLAPVSAPFPHYEPPCGTWRILLAVIPATIT